MCTPSSSACRHPQRYNWMVFNDFHITASLPEEVRHGRGRGRPVWQCLRAVLGSAWESDIEAWRALQLHARHATAPLPPLRAGGGAVWRPEAALPAVLHPGGHSTTAVPYGM